MCEGYLIGGDAFVKIEEDTRCCQTFTPTYTHTVAYLDLDCKFCDYYRRPTILITTTDENHKPTDNIITTGRTSWLAKYPTDELVRARFNLTWATLNEGVEYAIVIYYARPGTGQYLYWQYDAAGATYEGGIRLLSLDRGETWTPYPDSDHMFFEFGKEPAPLPSPDPPVENFAILNLEQEVTATGIKITVTTNVPCHLYCYWTDHEPGKHLIPILTRGIQLHTQLEYCFVDWHENEQEEASDTLFHTFVKEPWAVCETRWLTFRAKVMDEWVKSVGPIFKKHRTAPTEPMPTNDKCLLSVGEDGFCQFWNANSQTFTPDHDYTACRISLMLMRTWNVRETWGPYKVLLVEANGSCWLENVLWSYTGVSTELPVYGVKSWTNYELPDIALSSGVTYRIVVHTILGWVEWKYEMWYPAEAKAALHWWASGPPDCYTRGNRFHGCNFRDGGAVWTEHEEADHAFIVWE